MKPRVYIRADGNSEIGLGHVIRCLALADMLKRDFDCFFYTRFLTSYLEREAKKVCASIIKLPESEDHFNAFLDILENGQIVVLDNYFYTADYQKKIKSKKCKLVCIDDIHDKHFAADIVINHAGGISASDYEAESYTKFFLGFKYALLRQPFLDFAKATNWRVDNNNVMICLGGADPLNYTLQVLKFAMNKFPHLVYHIVMGGAFMHKDELDEYRKQNDNIVLHSSLSQYEFCNLMQHCSRAICSPSTVSLEYLCTKGELYLKCIADNQLELYKYYLDNHIGVDFLNFFQPKSSFNNTLVDKLFDGNQKERMLNIFHSLL